MTTRLDLILQAAVRTGHSQVDCRAVFEALIDLIPRMVAERGMLELRGHMTLYKSHRKGRMVRDIRRGKGVWMNGRYVMLCRFPRRKIP